LTIETADEQIPDSLIPSALTPSAWQFPIAYCLAFSDSLNALILSTFSLAVPIAIGALPQALPPFLS